MSIRSIKQAIDEFDEECEKAEYTDIGDAWDLLNWIRDQFKGLRPATKEEIKSARHQYGNTDIQVNHDAFAADPARGGVWVQAWVYLYPEED